MNRLVVFTGFGMALILAASTVSVRAEEGDMTQTHTQDRAHTQMNFQVPSSDFVQPQNRNEYTVMNQHQEKNQNQYQYKYMKQDQRNNPATSSMDRMSESSRYMQGSANAGSIGRQNFNGHSTGAGRR